MNVQLPELALVVLVGASSSGKTTFAAKHFAPHEVLASDAFRRMVANSESAVDASEDAFDALHLVTRKRLARGLLTVIDATNVQPEARRAFVRIAREFDVPPIAIVLDLPMRDLKARHKAREDRDFADFVIRTHSQGARAAHGSLRREGFRRVFALRSVDEVDDVVIERLRTPSDYRRLSGPFDIIGDVHGCFSELVDLFERMGWVGENGAFTHPEGRTAVFVGDLVDRGPDSPAVLELVMNMLAAGTALCVLGNHDDKLKRHLQGRAVQLAHGLELTVSQLESRTDAFRGQVLDLLESLPTHLELDRGRLVVAHAGILESYIGRDSGRVRSFCLYGQTTGERDEFGLPIRGDWAADYRGTATVVYGHTPVLRPEWVNNTVCVDAGCVFGGRLSALRYPERVIASVAAHANHCDGGRPLGQPQPKPYDLLDARDVLGAQVVETRYGRGVKISAARSAAALETMTRFAVDPRWLVHLPPTMSPCETAPDGSDLLEHPEQAVGYFAERGVERVIAQQKHRGSRAIIVLCRHAEIAAERFGVTDSSAGAIYTRTGRPFFDMANESEMLASLRSAVGAAGLWSELASDWVVLDAEILPWSWKAQTLIRDQYASVYAAGRAGLAASIDALERAEADGRSDPALLKRFRARAAAIESYGAAYRPHCGPAEALSDVRIAPFHVLASEGHVHVDRDHLWHLATIERIALAAPELVIPTPHRVVDTNDDAQIAALAAWWVDLTSLGNEGVVIKPLKWLARHAGKLIQPAIKCRGPEYLRMIYGPEYRAPEHIARLRGRSVHRKRSRALRELILGLEALHRFAERDSLRMVHACVFGVLALKSEPVDPRL